MKQIPYGEINFETIRTNNSIYIDKTSYIEKLEKDVNLKKVLYLRPGRFGKSLFTDMLDYYYAIDHKEKFKQLFGDLYIGKHPTINQNKYYILKFDFSGIDTTSEDTIKDMENKFRQKVIEGTQTFKERYQIQFEYNETMTPAAIIGNIFVAFKFQKPQQKIYVLIDEYDNFTNGILKENADKFLNTVSGEGFVKSFYARIKEGVGAGVVDRFFATGIAPITLDSMTTGFNIATDITRDKRFVSMIGLTKKEVQGLIKEVLPQKTEQEQEKIYEEMEIYYDGYRFSELNEEKTFNTTLVMYYLNYYVSIGTRPAKMLDRNIAANFEKLESLITLKNNPYSKEVLESLIQNREIAEEMTDKFNLAMDITKKDVLSILFYFGYCTIKEVKLGLKPSYCIPNYVMAGVYNEYFIQLLAREGIKIDTTKVDEAIDQIALEGKIDKLCVLVEEYLSYIGNISWQKYDEKYVKSYMHALLFLSPMYNTYLEFNVKNNRYIDVALFKIENMGAKYQAIIEVKYIKKEDAKTRKTKENAIKEKRNEAIEQIKAYIEDKRLPQEDMKKFIVIYVGQKLEFLEEV